MANHSLRPVRQANPHGYRASPGTTDAPAAAIQQLRASPPATSAPLVRIERDAQRKIAKTLHKIDLTTAGTLTVRTRSNVLWVKGDKTTTANSTLKIAFDDPNASPVPFKYGESMRGDLLTDLYLSWDAQAGETLYLFLAFDDRISSFYPY